MGRAINAHFDGNAIIPDEPVDLPVDQPLQIVVEVMNAPSPRFANLLELAVDLPHIPEDFAEQHDHYLYGSPKK